MQAWKTRQQAFSFTVFRGHEALGVRSPVICFQYQMEVVSSFYALVFFYQFVPYHQFRIQKLDRVQYGITTIAVLFEVLCEFIAFPVGEHDGRIISVGEC